MIVISFGDLFGTGNTPLLRINSLSNALGVEILVSTPKPPSLSRLSDACSFQGKAEVSLTGHQ